MSKKSKHRTAMRTASLGSGAMHRVYEYNTKYTGESYKTEPCGDIYQSLTEQEIEFRTPDKTNGFWGIWLLRDQPVFAYDRDEDDFVNVIITDLFAPPGYRFVIQMPREDFRMRFKRYKRNR